MFPFRKINRRRLFSSEHRAAAFTLIEVMMSITIVSICIAAVVPRLQSSKRQAMASTIVNDLRTFTGAFEAYAQERGTFPAEVAAGVVPPEVADRLNNTAWKRPTPIGGHYNWDSGQTHYGVTYRAVIQISETSTSPMIQDLELWEVIDKLMDDGNLLTGSFRLGAGDEPIYIIAQ